MPTPMFDENEKLTPQGSEICQEIDKFLDALYDKYVAQGFSTRDIETLVYEENFGRSVYKRIRVGIQRRKDLQQQQTALNQGKTPPNNE